jgi:hypothetical protein
MPLHVVEHRERATLDPRRREIVIVLPSITLRGILANRIGTIIGRASSSLKAGR